MRQNIGRQLGPKNDKHGIEAAMGINKQHRKTIEAVVRAGLGATAIGQAKGGDATDQAMQRA